jgi:hypothetical protein
VKSFTFLSQDGESDLTNVTPQMALASSMSMNFVAAMVSILPQWQSIDKAPS